MELLHQQQQRDAYQLVVRNRVRTVLTLRVTDHGDQQGVDRVASAVTEMFTGSAG